MQMYCTPRRMQEKKKTATQAQTEYRWLYTLRMWSVMSCTQMKKNTCNYNVAQNNSPILKYVHYLVFSMQGTNRRKLLPHFEGTKVCYALLGTCSYNRSKAWLCDNWWTYIPYLEWEGGKKIWFGPVDLFRISTWCLYLRNRCDTCEGASINRNTSNTWRALKNNMGEKQYVGGKLY